MGAMLFVFGVSEFLVLAVAIQQIVDEPECFSNPDYLNQLRIRGVFSFVCIIAGLSGTI